LGSSSTKAKRLLRATSTSASDRVRDIHRADDVQIVRYVHALPVLPAVAQFQSLGGGSFIRIQQRQHLAKYLRGIATVDFLDDDHKLRGWGLERRVDHFHEGAVGKRKLTVTGWPPAAHEILVRHVGVELQRPKLALITLPHQGKCQSLGQPSLARAWRTLKDQVLFRTKSLQEPF
jgi:hypothetical protein